MSDSFREFVNKNPTPYHVIESLKKKLTSLGYVEIFENKEFPNPLPQKAFVTRGDRSFIAFDIGSLKSAIVLSTHIDDVSFKVKSNYEETIDGHEVVRLLSSGNIKLKSFMDRELRAAGIVYIKNEEGKIEKILVDSVNGIAILPNLAVHLTNNATNPQFVHDKHFRALLGKTKLLPFIAKLANCNEDEIVQWDLDFIDAQPVLSHSMEKKMLEGGRICSMSGIFSSLAAFIKASQAQTENVKILYYYDERLHNNDGYLSAYSGFLQSIMSAIFGESLYNVIPKSLIVNIDNINGDHPSGSVSDPNCRPYLGKGLFIDSNYRNNFSSDFMSVTVVHNACKAIGAPCRDYYLKNSQIYNSPCGIALAANTGVRSVDVSLPILGLHAAHEMICWSDINTAIKIYSELLINFDKHKIVIDNNYIPPPIEIDVEEDKVESENSNTKTE